MKGNYNLALFIFFPHEEIFSLDVDSILKSFSFQFILSHHASKLFYFILFFLAMPAACGSSWARDQTLTTAVTQAAAVTMLDP